MKKSHRKFKISSHFLRAISVLLIASISIFAIPFDVAAFSDTDDDGNAVPLAIEDNLQDIQDTPPIIPNVTVGEYADTTESVTDIEPQPFSEPFIDGEAALPPEGEIPTNGENGLPIDGGDFPPTETDVIDVLPEPEIEEEILTEVVYDDRFVDDKQYTILTDGSVTVSGMMPPEVYLNVSEVPYETAAQIAGDKRVVFAYDIKVMRATGEEYQPNPVCPLLVSVETPQDAAITEPVDIFHISMDEAGQYLAKINQSTRNEEGKVSFGTECLSVFIGTVEITEQIPAEEIPAEVVAETPESDPISPGSTVTFDLSKGTVNLGPTFSGYDSSGAVISGTHDNTNKYVIMQSVLAPTENRIVFTGSSDAPVFDVTLNNIDCTGGNNYGLQGEKDDPQYSGICAVCSSGKNINLILRLSGVNKVGRLHYSTNGTTSGNSGLDSTCQSSLTITSAAGNGSDNGTLYAESRVNWSAAIGGTDKPEDTRNIFIKGGTIFAASENTAAIGGGGNGVATIEISGGKITATNRGTGATIGGGGGNNEAGATARVTITGGVISATNNGIGTAIGGGGSAYRSGSPAEVIITGGTINASSATGTAIGGGNSRDSYGGDATVNISGGNITATANGSGSAIGSGGSDSKGNSGDANITITGGIIVAQSNGTGTAIGTAASAGMLGGEAKISISGGTVTATANPAAGGAGIGGGMLASQNSRGQADIIITGGSVNASSTTAITTYHFAPDSGYASLIVYPARIKLSNYNSVNIINIFVNDISYNYGCKDMRTDNEGYLYMWLPDGANITSMQVQQNNGAPVEIPQQDIVYEATAIIKGNSSAGTTLEAFLHHGSVNLVQWQRYDGVSVWTAIPEATDIYYTLKPNDIGKFIRVVINNNYVSADIQVIANAPVYTITIPESITVNSGGGSFTVSSTGVTNLLAGQDIEVKVTSKNSYQLKSTVENSTAALNYKLLMDNEQLSNNALIMTQGIDSTQASKTINYSLVSTPQYSGTYTDTLTFTVIFNSGA